VIAGLSGQAILAVARRPRLWPTALAAAGELAPRDWWRHAPYLPLPDRQWMKFRLETAYGGEGTTSIRPDELITWLEWKQRA